MSPTPYDSPNDPNKSQREAVSQDPTRYVIPRERLRQDRNADFREAVKRANPTVLKLRTLDNRIYFDAITACEMCYGRPTKEWMLAQLEAIQAAPESIRTETWSNPDGDPHKDVRTNTFGEYLIVTPPESEMEIYLTFSQFKKLIIFSGKSEDYPDDWILTVHSYLSSARPLHDAMNRVHSLFLADPDITQLSKTDLIKKNQTMSGDLLDAAINLLLDRKILLKTEAMSGVKKYTVYVLGSRGYA